MILCATVWWSSRKTFSPFTEYMYWRTWNNQLVQLLTKFIQCIQYIVNPILGEIHREWKYLTDVSTSTSVKFFSLEESRWDFVDPCIHWMVQLNLTLTEISYSIYPNDQVITNISIDSAVEPISSKRSNVFNCLDIRIWRWCMLRAFSLVYLTTTGIRG